MTELVTTTLAQCCDIVSGATPQTSVAEYWDGDICWATPKDLSDLDGHFIASTPRKITKAGLSSCAASVLPANSVLFSSRAPIGHVALNTTPMATNQGFKSFIPRSNLLEPKFLFHWLRAKRPYLESLGNGATFKEVSKAVVARVEIALPPLSEQRRIAAILDQADALRAKRRQASAHLDSLTQSIFIEMFGTALTDQLVWPKLSLAEVADVLTGYAFKSDEFVDLGSSTVRLCRGTNVMPGRVDWQDLACWPKAGIEALSSFILVAGDIVMAMDRPWISEGFKIARITLSDCPALLVQRVARVRARPNALDDFLYGLLRQPAFAQHCRPTETTIPHISPREIRSFGLRLPPLALQQTFATRIQAVESLKPTHRAALAELNALFASLQHRAFAGQLS